jgi:hypothetical protein
VIGKKGTELVRPVGEHEKDVWDKSRLLLHGEDTVSDVLGHVGEIGDGEAADGKCVSHGCGVLWLRVANWHNDAPGRDAAVTEPAKRIGTELAIRCRQM